SSQTGAYAHTVFDRTLLRAGDTVHMKHVIRQPHMRGLSMLKDEARPKAVVIHHEATSQRYEFPVQWDAQGIAETAWTIPKDAKLGTYGIWLKKDLPKPQDKNVPDDHEMYYSPQGQRSGEFRVEEYRVPLMKGVIKGPAKPLVAVTEATVDLAVKYLAGGPAGHLPVKFRSQVQPKGFIKFDGFEGATFANGAVTVGLSRERQRDYMDWRDAVEEGEAADTSAEDEGAGRPSGNKKPPQSQSSDLVLDDTGGIRTMLSKLPNVTVPMDIATELEFRDPNGEVQTVAATIPIWPSQRMVGLKPDSWAATSENVKFQAIVVDLSGKPVAGVPVAVEMMEKKTYSHRKRLLGGFYAYEHVTDIKSVGKACEGKTDSRGIVHCDVRARVSGNVILQARAADEKGHPTVANTEVWIRGESDWWYGVGDDDRMDLLPERPRYEPGETAKFQVRMPFREATALITVEREGVIDAYVQALSGKNPVVELPIADVYAPNVFVSVLAVRGRVGDVQPTAMVDLGRPAYKLGIAGINVGWRAHELKVQVASNSEVYRVREKARITVAVKRADGGALPAGSEIALAAVDEGLLQLMPNQSWQILTAMMRMRNEEVSTSTAQMHVVGKRHFGLKAKPHGGGGGKEPTRELFDTLLLWKGRVFLNEKGEASVEVPLNDSVTSFRIAVVATGGSSFFGTGSTSIRSTQELMMFSGTAPLVREGDRYRSEFTVRNASNKPMQVTLSGRVTPLPAPLTPLTVALAPGEAKNIGWDLTAPVGVEQLVYEVEAVEKGGSKDRMKIVQKVVPAVPVRTFQATIAQLSPDVRFPVERPGDAIPGRGDIAMTVRASLVDGLGGVSEYMSRYPYSCLEQQVSKAVALRDDKQWQKIMNELPSYLDVNGLAKYWPGMRRGSDVLTSYLLAIAHEAGWTIPSGSLDRMSSGLTRFVGGSVEGYSPLNTSDFTIRKLAAIEALSRYDKAHAAMLDSVTIDPNLWPTSAVIDWSNIVGRVDGIKNRDARAKESQQILRSRLNFQGTTMGFSTEHGDQLWWLMTSNDTNAVRLVLAELASPQWKEDMPRIVRGAIGRQAKGHWDLTTANAWGMLAVEKFAAAFEQEPVTGTTVAAVATQSDTMDWSKDAKGAVRSFPWPEKQAELSVQHRGTGKPWLTVQSRAAIPLTEPLSSGYRIGKTLTPLTQKRAGVWSQGDVARVRLEIESQTDMTWVVVNDPVPGGASILGGVGREKQLATQGEEQKGWVWPAYEERAFDAFRSYYAYVPKGTFTVEYTVRFNQIGTYQLPSTRVEAMYSPEMFGEIPNRVFEVNP
ncbi:MAG: MG2 domain-containing protein, partial [Nitrospira sp.]|nr:MG2 domain-containing protein [Nitrospira sp.]